MIGKNLISQIKLAQKMRITQTEMIVRLKKNIQVGRVNFFKTLIILFFINFGFPILSSENFEGKFIEIKILDKVSSKNSLLKLKIGEEKKIKNLMIKSLKCKNSDLMTILK